MKRILAILCLLSFAFSIQSQPLIFKKASPPATATSAGDTIYAAGKFVAINGGSIIYSDDGFNWKDSPNISTNPVFQIAFGAGQFVAVGARVILNSRDGVDWSVRFVGDSNIRSVTYAGGLFLAGGGFTSEDGINWEERFTPWKIAFGDGKFIGLNGKEVFESQDGRNWIALTSDFPQWFDPACPRFECGELHALREILFANGRFIVHATYLSYSGTAGRLFFSDDGKSWRPFPSPNVGDLSGAWGDLLGLAVLDGKIIDPGPWIPVFFPDLTVAGNYPAPAPLLKIVGVPGAYVAVGYKGGLWRGNTFETANAQDWLYVSPPEESLKSIAAKGDLVVAVGGYDAGASAPLLILSTNRLRTTTRVKGPGGAGFLKVIRHANGRFLAVGKGGTIIRSFDGRVWTRQISNTPSDLSDITYGAGLWVAVGANGKIATSPDGGSFTLRFSGTELGLNGIAFNGNEFLVVGEDGAILKSPNGVDWTSVGDLVLDLSSVAWGDGVYVATGASGVFRASVDGIHWYTGRLPNAVFPEQVSFANGYFVAREASAPGTYYYSKDWINWTAATLPDSTILGVDATDGELWLVGERSSIWKSELGPGPNAISVRVRRDDIGRFVLSLTSTIDGDVVLQSTTNLNSAWKTEATFRNASSISWTNPAPSGSIFYRATAAQP